jgi:DNA repair photolyase
MFADRKYRPLTYHDTWMSLDPIRGCPFSCGYCVLRHSGSVGTRPIREVEPDECVRQLLGHPFFVPGFTPIAIGNETDMFHDLNVDYLVRLLADIRMAGIDNPIVLITKARLTDQKLAAVRQVGEQRVILFLSYSGLTGIGRHFEPNFTDDQLRENFLAARRSGFRVVHFWRPLLPENTTDDAIRQMLTFVPGLAEASVFVGLKLHPELTERVVSDGRIDVPVELRYKYGEWLEPEVVARIYEHAASLCPDHPLYRHSSCALAKVLSRPNHTATVFREDICPPSHCPAAQRKVCEGSRVVPDVEAIQTALRALNRPIRFERHPGRVVIHDQVSQEEFAYLLHNLNCPLEVQRVMMLNLYHGNIFSNQTVE